MIRIMRLLIGLILTHYALVRIFFLRSLPCATIVPTLNFGILHCFFVISQGRRRILHFRVTKRPDSEWVSQQLREAFPYDSAPKYLIFNRAKNFGTEVIATIKSFGITPKRISYLSP